MLKGGSWCPFAIEALRTEVFSSLASAVRVAWLNLHAKDYRGLGEVDVFSLQKLETSGIVCACSNIFETPLTRTLLKVDKRHSARSNNPWSFRIWGFRWAARSSCTLSCEGFYGKVELFQLAPWPALHWCVASAIAMRCYELYPSSAATS